MNILSILDQLGNLRPASADRRAMLARLGNAGWQAAAITLPLVAGLAQPASAKTADTVLDGIKVLVLLEQAQVAFYTQALASAVLPTVARPVFQLLLNQQQQHLTVLSQALTDAALPVPVAPTFDFSGRHNTSTNPELFPNVFSNYVNFLELAQQLEDASVRIYLGQLPSLAAERLIYTAALGMQTTESRHAAHLRTLRREAGAVVKSWPSTTDTVLAAPVRFKVNGVDLTLYAGDGTAPPISFPGPTNFLGENNDFQTIPGPTKVPFATLLTVANGLAVPSTAVAEAFDEPLTTASAEAVLALFS